MRKFSISSSLLIIIILIHNLSLSVGIVPNITQFDLPATTEAGKVLVATCVATGEPPITIEWLKDSSNPPSYVKYTSELNSGGNTASMLTILGVQLQDEGSYTCIASNSDGKVHQTKSVTIYVPPKWLKEPGDIDISIGEPLEIKCAVFGKPEPTTIWSKDNLQLIREIGNANLKFRSIQRKDAGIYTCESTNTIDGKTNTLRKRIDIKVNEKSKNPYIVQFKIEPEVQVGDKLVVVCVASGPGILQFRWLKDSQELRPLTNFEIRNDTDTSMLKFYAVQLEDQGNYTCIVSNSFGKASSTQQLKVKAPPKWIAEPVDVSVIESHSLSVLCSAKGSPLPEVKWINKVENRVLTNNYGSSILNFSNALRINGGRFICKASNSLGSIEKEIFLNVQVPAKFVDKFRKYSVRKAQDVTLVCEAEGDKPLSITWKFNNESLLAGYKHEIKEVDIEFGKRSNLLIRSTEISDDGNYICVAQNKFGTSEQTNKLEVRYKPPAPQGLKAAQIWTRDARISWKPTLTGSASITSYILKYWRSNAEKTSAQKIETSNTEVKIQDLRPGIEYKVVVSAVNDIGTGAESDPVTFTTHEEAPSAPPSDVFAISSWPRTIRVNWKPVPEEHRNGDITDYFVGYRLVDLSNRSNHTFYTVKGTETEYFIRQLKPNSEYSIVVKARNRIGSSVASPEKFVRTKSDKGVPRPPRLLSFGANSDCIKLRWIMGIQEINTPNILDYSLFYRTNGEAWRELTVLHEGDITDYVLKDLDPSVYYYIYVAASNEHGTSDPSNVLSLQTESMSYDGGVGSFFTSLNIPASTLMLLVIIASIVLILIVMIIACVCVRKAQLKAGRPRFDLVSSSLPKQNVLDASTLRCDGYERSKPLMTESYDAFPPGYEYSTKRMYSGAVLNESSRPFIQHHVQSTPPWKPWQRPLPDPEAEKRKREEAEAVYDYPIE